jgi:hypothetical protein
LIRTLGCFNKLKDILHTSGLGFLTCLTRLHVTTLIVILSMKSVIAFAETPTIGLELNGLQTIEGRCRITLLLSNGFPSDLERLVIELVLFDNDRNAFRFMRVALSELRANRSHVQAFATDNLECQTIANVLLNDVVECRLQGVEDDICNESILTSSRAPAGFIVGFPVESE